MPNQIDASGVTIQTRDEIVAELVAGFKSIYGADINTDPNSPDGQLINLFAQGKIDVLEFLVQLAASFDPDMAIGRVLDMRCAINGVVRKAGTYTLQQIDVTVTQALTIAGLDTAPDAPFTVSDSAGNQFVLVAAYAFGAAGTIALSFRAAKLGAIETTPNTITRVNTIQLGVASVNNPSAATAIGTDEESDFALRVRRAKSVAIPSKGYLDGLLGALLAVDGVTAAVVYENYTSVPFAGVPAHSIWAIVAGGVNADIAQTIYVKRNAGCGMKGAVDVTVPQADGSVLHVLFDRPTPQNLWIKFDVTAITGIVDAAYIRGKILAQLSYNIGQPADASAIVAMVKALVPTAYVSNEGVAAASIGPFIPLLTTTGVDYQFAIAAVRIVINGTPG